MPHEKSPLLTHCPPGLPQGAYLDEGWFACEERAIWRRDWIHAGRLDSLAPGRMRPLTIGGAPILLARLPDRDAHTWH